ncbi:o-succinylbenzoate--CoA ligase [Peribacillus sp. SCS-155]|uniref:o-succinylbenzoate--CoA ligase n=1 Tax=Peribacillus sedimenti TaxID=3115297 RepID=UPI003905BC3B
MKLGETIPNWLRKRADISPERVAVEFENKTYTFKQLDSMAERYAKKLDGRGIEKGDTCGVLVRNHIDSIAILHGLFYLGVRVVFLNNRLTAHEMAWQLEDSNAKWLVTEEFFKEKLESINSDNRNLGSMTKESIETYPEAEKTAILKEFNLSDPATIMYTSGTSGTPKGVIQTFGNHWWSAMGSSLNLGLHDNDCWYCAVPIFHISGLSILMRSVIYGMKVILAERFEEEEANRAIKEKGVTIISVVSAMLNRMLLQLEDSAYPDTFRCMLLGGGPAPIHLLEECKRLGIPIFQTYGMTETSSQIVTLPPEDSLRKIGSAGKPLFPSQLRIEIDGREAMPNEAGEIAVSGPNVTGGYLNRPEATIKSIREGWLYTGDIGYLDDEGFLFVLDRRSDLIISGGENVYPAEIESVISHHPAIFEAGITSQKDERWGEVPVAFVVLHEGEKLTEQELIAYCKERLAPYKIPKRVIFSEALPRNSSNKLLRRELKNRLENV